MNRAACRGFTPVELIVSVSALVILAALTSHCFILARDKTRAALCISNLRTIGNGILVRAVGNNGLAYSRDEIGNSSFRAIDDPLGLPELLRDQVPRRAWTCPAGRPSLKPYQVSYAWSRSQEITSRPITAIDHPSSTALLWDNHTMLQPSIHGVSEGPTGGPNQVRAEFRRYPHDRGRRIHWFYADGHIDSR